MAPIQTYDTNAQRQRAYRQRHPKPPRPRAKTSTERVRAHRQRRQKHLKVIYRSVKPDWATPQAFFETLDSEFHFTLDVAADAENAKCPRYFTCKDDALQQRWEGICWMNPPYGRALPAWLQKAYESAKDGATVVCLLPARTDRRWWHTYALRGEIRFVPGRLTFAGAENPAPFASVIVIFRPPEVSTPQEEGDAPHSISD